MCLLTGAGTKVTLKKAEDISYVGFRISELTANL